MTERLLQFIWQFQYFNSSSLETEDHEPIVIINPGQYNTDQGPDFLAGKVKIGSNTWVGNIELHTRASDWNLHQHTKDFNYNNIVLHVVWEYDIPVSNSAGINLPTLSLQSRVPKFLLLRYEALMFSQGFVPSQQHLPALSNIAWVAWKERLIAERLQRKSTNILACLQEANNHWEEVFWWMLCRSFGVKVNTSIFESIARSIPLNVIARHKNQIHQLEGLLLGQAGLLEAEFEEDYPKLLQREYRFLQRKYSLMPVKTVPFFLRMRPANFPTLRLAQLAMVIHGSSHLFTRVKETDDLSEVEKWFDIEPNDYWLYHYIFDDPGQYKLKPLGDQMITGIIINTIVPVLFAYGVFTKDQHYKDKAIRWLGELPPEKNNILKQWVESGVTNINALESQALLELKSCYCDPKRCLECAVGTRILKETGA